MTKRKKKEYNPYPDVEVCPYAFRYLKCPLRKFSDCPVQDTQFVRFIRKYCFIPRLNSPPLEFVQFLNIVHESKKTILLSEAWRAISEGLSRARLYQVLSFFYDLAKGEQIHKPKLNLTAQVCKDIRQIRTKYNDWVRRS